MSDSTAPPPHAPAPAPGPAPAATGGAPSPSAARDAAFDWEHAARAYNRRVIVHLLARGLTFDDAEEVAQRTWTRLIALDRAGRLARIEMPGLALAQARFLAATLRRERDQAHAGGAAAHTSDADELELVIDDRVDAERSVLARDRVERALAELERAPSSALRVFRRVLDDPPPTHAQLATELGLSEQRVRQIVCETRARLRRAMSETQSGSTSKEVSR